MGSWSKGEKAASVFKRGKGNSIYWCNKRFASIYDGIPVINFSDYLIVGLSTDEFNANMKKICYFNYEQRKNLLQSIRYVDLVIPEDNWEQKKSDVKEFKIDTFVIGDDWKGKFDFLKEQGVEVVYLPRTAEISTTQIKSDICEKRYKIYLPKFNLSEY